ncbi:MAG TPA: alpha/beta hydrolase-fold protein [Acidobacteriaceae bacterium]
MGLFRLANRPSATLRGLTMAAIQREYYKWFSPHLHRDMELLVFGGSGSGNPVPAIAFPTARGRFFELEDTGMVQVVAPKLERGEIQIFCVDNLPVWNNPDLPGDEKIAQQLQYEAYVLEEVLPLIHKGRHHPHVATAGFGFGGYHAVNMALRHPDRFQSFLSLGGTFDVTDRLNGHMDEATYLNLPTYYIPNLVDAWYLDRYRHNTYILATGEEDTCRGANEKMAAVLRARQIPCRLDVWGSGSGRSWDCWQKMLRNYL